MSFAINSYLENLYFKCFITWIICFGHWANEKAKKGEGKKSMMYPQLININHFNVIIMIQ
jgi:hypothetical protein